MRSSAQLPGSVRTSCCPLGGLEDCTHDFCQKFADIDKGSGGWYRKPTNEQKNLYIFFFHTKFKQSVFCDVVLCCFQKRKKNFSFCSLILCHFYFLVKEHEKGGERAVPTLHNRESRLFEKANKKALELEF
jgi:hypothetical protein